MQAAIEHAKDVKHRLLRPHNAVPDKPIDLRYGKAFAVKGSDPHLIFVPKSIPRPDLSPRGEVAKSDFVPIRRRPFEPSAEPSLEDILEAVSLVSGISFMDLKSERRTTDVVVPRQIAMLMAKMLTRASLPKIGRFLGGRDHTTVLHALRKMQPLEAVLRITVSENAPLLMYALAAINLESQMKDVLSRRNKQLREAKTAA